MNLIIREHLNKINKINDFNTHIYFRLFFLDLPSEYGFFISLKLFFFINFGAKYLEWVFCFFLLIILLKFCIFSLQIRANFKKIRSFGRSCLLKNLPCSIFSWYSKNEYFFILFLHLHYTIAILSTWTTFCWKKINDYLPFFLSDMFLKKKRIHLNKS